MVQSLGWRPTAVLDKRTTDDQNVAFNSDVCTIYGCQEKNQQHEAAKPWQLVAEIRLARNLQRASPSMDRSRGRADGVGPRRYHLIGVILRGRGQANKRGMQSIYG